MGSATSKTIEESKEQEPTVKDVEEPMLRRPSGESASTSDDDHAEQPMGSGISGSLPFTPKTIQMDKCMARTWNDGKGGQCHNLPSADSEFCTNHLKNRQWQVHGRVDGQIPLKKMSEFQLKSKKPSRHSQHVRKVSQK